MPRGLTIGYDATAAVRQRAGIARYTRELLLALLEVAEDDEFRVIYQSWGASIPLPSARRAYKTYPMPLTDRVTNIGWHRLRLPIPVEARTGGLSLFHSPDFSLAPSRAPSVVTIHDLAFEIVPQYTPSKLAAYLGKVVPRSIHRAAAVIAPSSQTKLDIIERYGIEPGKIHVIPEGVQPHAVADGTNDINALARLGIGKPYLLSLGTLEPRKNYERLIAAFDLISPFHPELVLVIVGREGWLCDDLVQTLQAPERTDTIRWVQNADDDDVAMLLRNSEVVICASLYEGFGLPALEALASGCPLICSGNSSFPEIVGDVAALFDPWDVEDIAETLESLLNDTELRNRMRVRGPKQASAFTWTDTAIKTAELYHRVAS